MKILQLINRNKLLMGILIIAALLRFLGISPGFHPYHSDEGMSYSSALEMVRNINLDPTRYDYPSLIPIINAVIFATLFIPIFVTKNLIFSPEFLPPQYRDMLELWQLVLIQNQQTVVMFWGRWITAFFGVGVVLLVYLVANLFFKDKKVALTAAFLTTVNFRQVLNSHLALPDIYNAFFLLLSLLSLGYLLNRATLKNYLFAGAAIALYFSTKFQTFTIPAFGLIHLIHVWRATHFKSVYLAFKSFFRKEFILAVLVIPIIILAINHQHLVHWDKTVGINSYNLLKYGVGTKSFSFFPISYLYHIGIGQFIFISIILGIILALKQNFLKTIILLLPIIQFMYLFLYYTRGGYYTRNFVTITPLLLIFAAIFLVWLVNLLPQVRFKIFKNLLLGLIVLLVSLNQIENSLINVVEYLKPWSFEQAANFAAINMPNHSTVVSHPWDKYPRNKDLQIVPLEPSTVFTLVEMREEGADFAFINMDWLTLHSYWWMTTNTQKSLEFWEKPNAILSNGFGAIATRELGSYAIAAFVKPWQAPDMNMLIVKIPPEIEIREAKEIKSFGFESRESLSNWSLIDGREDSPQKIYFDGNEGGSNLGSIKIENGPRRYPVIRATSPVVAIKEYKIYTITAQIKSDQALSKKTRDGFLRVDFFESSPGKIGLKTKAISSSISSRAYGSDNWTHQEVRVIAPKRSKFMSVGIQTNDSATFWLDDIAIFESIEEVADPRGKPPFIDYQIPDDILFPYSQGGL